MRTVYASVTRRSILLATTCIIILVMIIIVISREFDIYHKKFNIKYAVKLPDRQLNETEWGYEEIAFPRASMISDEYKMPQFIDERDLDLPLGLRDTGDWSQDGQSLIVDALLGGKDDGFYVEVGADDGEHLSNSLFFEVFRHWRGIIVEPNQESFAKLQRVHRKTLMLNACVSPTNMSETFTFVINPFENHDANFLGGISEYLEFTEDGIIQAKYEQHFASGDLYKPIVQTIRCSPLLDLLPEFVKEIDYLSLDTEGTEIRILKTIPFDEVKIRVISVDVSSITGVRRDNGLKEFLTPLGYTKMFSLKHDDIYMLKE